MKQFRVIGIVFLVLSLMVSAVYAAPPTKDTEVDFKESYEYSFEEEAEFLKELGVTDALIQTLKAKFNEAVAYEEAQEFDKADQAWEAYYEIIDNNIDLDEFDYEDDFDDEYQDDFELPEDVEAKLNTLLEQVEALEAKEEFDASDKVWEEIDELLEPYYDFEDDYEDDFELPEDVEAKLNTLLEQVEALEAKEDFDAADKVWEEIDELLEPYSDCTDCYEDFSFESLLEELEFEGITLSEDRKTTLETLFNEAIALEEAGEDAEAKWIEFEDLLYDLTGFEGFDENIEIQAVYNVKDGKLVLSTNPEDYMTGQAPKELSQEMRELHQKMWKRASQLIPASQMQYFKSLEIGTDGAEGILASVVELDNLSKWQLFLDTADSIRNGKFTSDFDYTVIHELGHIVTLNSSQLSKDKITGTYATEEGYSKANSYINAFYQTFWQTDKHEDEYERYESNPAHFVSDYAATNIEEDMAESFAEFITKDKPNGNDLKDKKVQFFYNYPELIKMRDEIRSNL
jgi:hypothetical protein